MEINPVVIHDAVMEEQLEFETMNAEEQDSGSEVSDEDSWDIDPIIRSETILKAAASGAASDCQINTLSVSGSAGVAAAAAILSGKRRGSIRPYGFETNPTIRKRQQTRLLGKIRALCGEYCTRVGQQAVFIAAVPGKINSHQTNNFKIVGSSPFDTVIRNNKPGLIRELDAKITEYGARPETAESTGNGVELPSILVEGIPAAVDEMTQAMLRNFIPVLLKCATGRGKPGWGHHNLKPDWWPDCLPWANIRSDIRTEEQRQRMGWTDALREVVKSCYKHHGHEKMLSPFPVSPQQPADPMPVTSNGDFIMQSLSGVFNGPSHQIVSNSRQQIMIAATDSNGVAIHIPIAFCNISQDSSGEQQIQLVMPAPVQDSSTSDGGPLENSLNYDMINLVDCISCSTTDIRVAPGEI